MSENTVEKNVYFYKTFADPSFNSLSLNGSNASDRLSHMFKAAFPSGCISYIFSDELNTHHFEIISFDESHIFGIHSKEESSPNPFMQFRNKVTNQTESLLSKEEPEKVLEYYTFFYVDFSKLMTAVIYNKQAGSLEKVLTNYFFQCDCNLTMISYSIDDINTAIKRFHSFSGFEFIYNEKAASTEFRTLPELSNFDMEIGSYKVNIKIKKGGSKLASEICNLSKDKYSSFKIQGQSEDDMNQCFDAVKKLFMRSAKILISKNPQDNLDSIKKTLASEIIKISDY